MVMRKNSRKRSLKKNRKKSKKRSFRKNRKKSQKRGGGKDSFWDWLPPVDTVAVRRICQKILNKGQSNSGIFVPYSDPVEYIQDFSFAYQKWQNEKGFEEANGKFSMSRQKKSRENFVKALGVIGATIAGMYAVSQIFYPEKGKKKIKKDFRPWWEKYDHSWEKMMEAKDKEREERDKEKEEANTREVITVFGSFLALTSMASTIGTKEEKKKYQEVLDIVADEWNERYAYQITGKQVGRIITNNPKAQMDMKKIKILNKMNSNDRNLIAHQQAMNLHQQAHNKTIMMHNQAMMKKDLYSNFREILF